MEKTKGLTIQARKSRTRQLSYIAILIAIFLTTTVISTPLARADEEWTDPSTNDIYCVSALEIYAAMADYDWEEGPENYEQVAELLAEVKNAGVQTSEPACINMILVELIVGDDGNTTIRITMAGDIEDCDYVQIYAWGNCSDDTEIGLTMNYQAGEGTTFGYSENNNLTETEGDIDGAKVEWSFPTDLFEFDEDECSLMIISLTATGDMSDPSSLTICFDVFPEEAFNFDPGTYAGPDPIVNAFDYIATVLFGIMCGRLGFLLLIVIFAVIAKVLIDRKMRLFHYSGLALMAFTIYLSISYAIFIDVTAGDLFIPNFSIIALIDLISFLSIIAFSLFTIANAFRLTKDNDWLLILGTSIPTTESVMYLLPFYFYSCAGSPVISLIVQIITIVASMVAVRLSLKYKNKRGGR